MILSILAVFLFYGIFYDYEVAIFPSMIEDNGGDMDFALFMSDWYNYYFPIGFVISLIIFVFVNAQRSSDTE
jgi:uncharacterized membrane protein